MPSPGRGVCLQTAFLNEARPDRRNVRLGIAKRVWRRMDRVVPQDEIVFVRSGRAEGNLEGKRNIEAVTKSLLFAKMGIPHRQCEHDPHGGANPLRSRFHKTLSSPLRLPAL